MLIWIVFMLLFITSCNKSGNNKTPANIDSLSSDQKSNKKTNLSFDEIKILIETWEYSKAIDNLLKIKDNLLSERNSVEKKQELWQIYSYMWMCYLEMQEFDKSLEMYDKAYAIAIELDNKEWQIRNINDISLIYLDYIEDKKPCLNYFQKWLELIDNLDQKSFELYQHAICLIYHNLSNYYVDAKDINSAKKYFDKAKEIVDKNLHMGGNDLFVRQWRIEEFALMTIESDFLIAESKYQEAIDNYLKAFGIVEKLDHKAYQEWIYNAVSDLYKEKFGDYKKSYEFKEKAIAVREKRISSDSQKAIREAEVRYKSKELQFDNERKQQEIEIQKQKKRTAWGGALIAIILAMVAIGFGYTLRKKNEQIQYKNSELNSLNEELTSLNETISQTNEKLAFQQKEIESSITYASRIQRSILYNDIRSHFSNSFVFYKPKDIVSGDFYFSSEDSQGRKVLVVADCTGHGVPGALLTIFGNVNIKQSLLQAKHPSDIINYLDCAFMEHSKHQNTSDYTDENINTNDAMDIACIFLDTVTNTIEYSSSGRPVLVLRNSEPLKLLPTNKAYVGSSNKPLTFSGYKSQTFQLQADDEVFLFSDGITDQFGGINGKKLGMKGLIPALQELSKLPTAEKRKNLEVFIESHMKPTVGKTNEQIDDICLVGFRV